MIDTDSLRGWLGRTESTEDHIGPTPVAALAATMDWCDPPPGMGDVLPPLWHWLFFLPRARQRDIGQDGLPKRGVFLPPVPLPRRMWAGSRMWFHHPLRIGDAISRVSQIVDIGQKKGRAGHLVFVLIRHQVSNERGVALTQEDDIVYLEHPRLASVNGALAKAAGTPEWSREIRPDESLLFRYSALTFDSHRIHYDGTYVCTREGYPGLVIQGPLLATLLMDLLRRHRPDVFLSSCSFRAVTPLFANAPFWLCGMPSADGNTADLWVKGADGALAMQARVTIGGEAP